MTSSLSLPASSPFIAPQHLSEDVAHLLTWGRRLLKAQQQQRRNPRDRLASHDRCRDPSRVHSFSCPATAAWGFKSVGSQAHTVTAPTHKEKGSPGTSDAVHTDANAPDIILRARRRLTQLEELEETNTRVFNHRWSLLRLGCERLLRLHRNNGGVEIPSPRTRQLQRLTATVQAIVEGEASLKEVLRQVLRALSELHQEQRQQHDQDERNVNYRASTRDRDTGLVESVHVGALWDSAEEGTLDPLCTLVDTVERHTRSVLNSHYQWQKTCAEHHTAAATRLKQCAVREEALRRQLEELRSAVAEATEEEVRERSRLSEMRAQCAAAEHAAALQSAASLRTQATAEAMQRLQLLQQHATSQSEIARLELAASQVRYNKEKIDYDMKMIDHSAAEEARVTAQKNSHLSRRRRDVAERDLKEVQRALISVSHKCSELRAQREVTLADCAAMEKALDRRQPTRDDPFLTEEVAVGADVGITCALGGPMEANFSPQHHVVLQRELQSLEENLQHRLEEVSSLEQVRAKLMDTLEREKKALDLLCRQKTALETHLASPGGGLNDAREPGRT